MTTLFKTTKELFALTNREEGLDASNKREEQGKRLDARNRARLYTARIWL